MVVVSMILACLLAGCGYRFARQGGGAAVLIGKRIAIPVFANKSYRPNLEAILTESVIREVALRTGGKVVPVAEAELLLAGTVTSFGTYPVAYTSADKIKTYRARMTIDVTLMEMGSRKVLWKGGLAEGQDYPAESTISFQQNREQAAIAEIGRKLAQKLYRTVGEDY
jgi:hypothetical protein